MKNWLKGYHKTEEREEYDGVTRHRTDGVDIIKSCVSVPGVAKKLMDQYTHNEEGFQGFYLFGDKEQDLVHLFRDTICGGPSIVYNREVNHGQGIIIGHDVNGLYSKVLMDEMPCICSPNTNLVSFMKINGAEVAKGFSHINGSALLINYPKLIYPR